MDLDQLPSSWKIQKNPPGITRSFNFDEYQETSKFLDDLAELSKEMDYYPNLNFTRTQVNVNIDVTGKIEELNQDSVELGFAIKADTLLALPEDI